MRTKKNRRVKFQHNQSYLKVPKEPSWYQLLSRVIIDSCVPQILFLKFAFLLSLIFGNLIFINEIKRAKKKKAKRD